MKWAMVVGAGGEVCFRRDDSAGPDDSSAWLFAPSFPRARTGADRYSGFQAFAVGSHHFVGALDFQPRLAARIPLAKPFAFVRPRPAGRHIGRPSSSAR